jgi:hypothetical protein
MLARVTMHMSSIATMTKEPPKGVIEERIPEQNMALDRQMFRISMLQTCSSSLAHAISQ